MITISSIQKVIVTSILQVKFLQFYLKIGIEMTTSIYSLHTDITWDLVEKYQ